MRWNHGTIRKGEHELAHGVVSMHTPWRSRKRSEEYLPNLLSNITALADAQSQEDP